MKYSNDIDFRFGKSTMNHYCYALRVVWRSTHITRYAMLMHPMVHYMFLIKRNDDNMMVFESQRISLVDRKETKGGGLVAMIKTRAFVVQYIIIQ